MLHKEEYERQDKGDDGQKLKRHHQLILFGTYSAFKNAERLDISKYTQ
jgi:hypothetical protein